MKLAANSARARQFLFITLLTASGILAGMFCLVLLVDPYGIYGSAKVAGFNLWKTELNRKIRPVKLQQVRWGRPKSVVFGSSSAEAGFNPGSSAWDQPGYNMAYSAGRVRETATSLRFATHFGLKNALVVLDFTNFHADAPEGQLILDPDRWFGNSSWLLDQLKVTIGHGAISDSLKTIINQTEPANRKARGNVPRLEIDGMRSIAFSERTIQRLGQSEAFRRKIAHRMTRTWFFPPCRMWRTRNSQGKEPGYENVRDMVRAAKERGINVKFVIPTVHPSIFVAMEAVGVLDDYENWKRRLVEVLAEESQEQEPHALLDFAVISQTTREPVPKNGSPKMMEKYFDPLHFKPHFGELILQRAFQGKPVAGDESFGRMLTRDNIEAHLAQQRLRLSELAEANEYHERFVEPAMPAHHEWIVLKSDDKCDLDPQISK